MRLLVVAAKMGYQTRTIADAARRLGVDVTLATDRCHVLEDPWGDQAIPVHFEDLEKSAGEVAAGGHFDAIVAVDDSPAFLAALIAERAGIPFHSAAAARAATNKFLARQCFREAGLPVPGYRRFGLDEIGADIHYPCVLKPLGLSASRGVIRADNRAEFAAAFARIRALLRSPSLARLRDPALEYIQVEDFIPGREFALEGLVTGGRLQVLALFDKPDPLDGPYFAETIYLTPSREAAEVQAAIFEAAQQAVTALGLTQGPVHAEMRVNGKQVWMLEVAPRPIGGLCAKMLVFGGGIPLEELVVRHALGGDVSTIGRRDGAAGVMMIPVPRAGVYRGVAGLEQAEAIADEVIMTAKEGQRVLPLPEGNTYLGFLFTWDESPDLVESRLRRAHGELRFDIAATLPLV
jgi:biotin carboxylase